MAKTISNRFNMLIAAGGVVVGMFVIPAIADKFFPDDTANQTITKPVTPAHNPK